MAHTKKQSANPCTRALDACDDFRRDVINRLLEIEKCISDLKKNKAPKDTVKLEIRSAEKWRKGLGEQWKRVSETLQDSLDAMFEEVTSKMPTPQTNRGQRDKKGVDRPLEVTGANIHVPQQTGSPTQVEKRPTSDERDRDVKARKGDMIKDSKAVSPSSDRNTASEDGELTKIPEKENIADEKEASLRTGEQKRQDMAGSTSEELAEKRKKELDECHEKLNAMAEKLKDAKDEIERLNPQLYQCKEDLSAEKTSKERDLKSLKTENQNLEEKIRKLQNDETDMQKRNTKLQRDLDDKSSELRRTEEDLDGLKQDLKKLQNDKKALEADLKYWKDKFGQLASDKVQSDPDVADLGDPHRALKIADKYSDIYDNMWTKAYRAQRKLGGRKEREIVENLRNVLKEAFTYCENKAIQQEEQLKNILMCPIQTIKEKVNPARRHDDRGLQLHLQKMKEVRKALSVGAVEDVKQAFWEDCRTKLSELPDAAKRKEDEKFMDASKEYYRKCVEVCWPMALHNPPLYIKMDVKHGEPVDHDLYTCRSSGDYVDMLVWPPLYQGEKGDLLAKGVVEALKVVSKKTDD